MGLSKNIIFNIFESNSQWLVAWWLATQSVHMILLYTRIWQVWMLFFRQYKLDTPIHSDTFLVHVDQWLEGPTCHLRIADQMWAETLSTLHTSNQYIRQLCTYGINVYNKHNKQDAMSNMLL